LDGPIDPWGSISTTLRTTALYRSHKAYPQPIQRNTVTASNKRVYTRRAKLDENANSKTALIFTGRLPAIKISEMKVAKCIQVTSLRKGDRQANLLNKLLYKQLILRNTRHPQSYNL